MFHHVKELQFDVRVSEPDPRFARLLLEQFGGGNGELKAAMQYFTQAFTCRRPYPDKYDLLMGIATEEFSHLEIVGALITLLLDGVNSEMKNAVERSSLFFSTVSIWMTRASWMYTWTDPCRTRRMARPISSRTATSRGLQSPLSLGGSCCTGILQKVERLTGILHPCRKVSRGS
mgnify:CR=1 FL=1